MICDVNLLLSYIKTLLSSVCDSTLNVKIAIFIAALCLGCLVVRKPT